MEVLDNILASYAVAANETTVQNSLLGVGLMVINETGTSCLLYSSHELDQ
jgi:hypothetical protein